MKVTSITTGRKVGDKISNRASNKKKEKTDYLHSRENFICS